jgi:hypothetical protein
MERANLPGPERESAGARVAALLEDYRPSPDDAAPSPRAVSARCVLEDSLHRRRPAAEPLWPTGNVRGALLLREQRPLFLAARSAAGDAEFRALEVVQTGGHRAL